MTISALSSFGGVLRIGNKEYPVKGRTYRKIFEQSSWWISECFCPVVELRRFLLAYPDFNEKDFIKSWLKASRQAMLVDDSTQRRIMSTSAGRRFDVWQACRDDGLTFEELDSHLDSLGLEEVVKFFHEADRKMSIANSIGEFDFLATCYRQVPEEGGSGRSVESMIAQLCVRNEHKIGLDTVLNSTPGALRVLFTDPQHLVDDIDAERNLHPNDKLGQKRISRVYERMAENIASGKRIDAYVPPQPKPKAVKPQEKPKKRR